MLDIARTHHAAGAFAGVHLRGGSVEYLGDPDLRFPLASCTKSFTARAVELAGIDLTAPVRSLLPDFRLSDPRATDRMTVEDLLCHRSGLPPHTWAWVFAEGSDLDFVRERLPHLESAGPHDERYRYSNITYAVAGALLPGGACAAIRRMLDDLGLSATGWQDIDWHLPSNVARPHRGGVEIPPFHAREGHPISAASELMGSARDLGRWLAMWLTADTECLRPRQRMPNGRWYGLGWRIWGDLAYHTGSCSGYSSVMGMRRERGEAVALLHAEHGQTDWLLGCARTELGLDEGGLPAVPHEMAPPAEDVGAPDPTRSGEYFNPGYGHWTVREGEVLMDGTPAGRIDAATGDWHLAPYGQRFAPTWKDDAVSFALEPKSNPINFAKRD